MRRGWSVSLFQASQQWATMSSWFLKTRFKSQFWRMNCQTFSTGFSAGERDGRGGSVTFSETARRPDMCQPA